LDSGPRKRVVDDDLLPLAGEAIGEIAADESGAAGDQDRATVGLPDHATSPLASSSARACSTWSSALWRATHSASSARPSSKSLYARKPSTSWALVPSQMQWRMSPTCDLPKISVCAPVRSMGRLIDPSP